MEPYINLTRKPIQKNIAKKRIAMLFAAEFSANKSYPLGGNIIDYAPKEKVYELSDKLNAQLLVGTINDQIKKIR